MSRRPASALAALALLALTACGQAEASSADVLRATAERLREVRSGRLDLRMTATSAALAKGQEVGVRVAGGFDVDGDDALPLLDVEVERIGQGQPTTGVRSDGERLWLLREDAAYLVPPEQAASLASGEGGNGRASTGLEGLDIGDWFVDPTLSKAGGADVVRAKLDVAAAMTDIAALLGRYGADTKDVPGLPEAEAQALRDATREATVEVISDADDHTLRRLSLRAVLGRDDPALPEAMRRLLPVTITMVLSLTDAGKDLRVEAPPSARPLAELSKG